MTQLNMYSQKNGDSDSEYAWNSEYIVLILFNLIKLISKFSGSVVIHCLSAIQCLSTTFKCVICFHLIIMIRNANIPGNYLIGVHFGFNLKDRNYGLRIIYCKLPNIGSKFLCIKNRKKLLPTSVLEPIDLVIRYFMSGKCVLKCKNNTRNPIHGFVIAWKSIYRWDNYSKEIIGRIKISLLNYKYRKLQLQFIATDSTENT